jgi:hypothetical protein
VKISAFCKVRTCYQQGVYKRTLKLVFTINAELGKASAVAAAMDRESRNVFEEFDHGFHGCSERLWKTG